MIRYTVISPERGSFMYWYEEATDTTYIRVEGLTERVPIDHEALQEMVEGWLGKKWGVADLEGVVFQLKPQKETLENRF